MAVGLLYTSMPFPTLLDPPLSERSVTPRHDPAIRCRLSVIRYRLSVLRYRRGRYALGLVARQVYSANYRRLYSNRRFAVNNGAKEYRPGNASPTKGTLSFQGVRFYGAVAFVNVRSVW